MSWAINIDVMIIMIITIIAYCSEGSKVTWAIKQVIMIITIIAYCAGGSKKTWAINNVVNIIMNLTIIDRR